MAILEIMDGSFKMINNFHRYDKIKSYMYLEKHTTMVDRHYFIRSNYGVKHMFRGQNGQSMEMVNREIEYIDYWGVPQNP
jgi:hypothetical protein